MWLKDGAEGEQQLDDSSGGYHTPSPQPQMNQTLLVPAGARWGAGGFPRGALTQLYNLSLRLVTRQ